MISAVSFIAVRLPELLSQANIEEETLMELQQKLVDLLKYLFLFWLLSFETFTVGFRVEIFNKMWWWPVRRVLFRCVCSLQVFKEESECVFLVIVPCAWEYGNKYQQRRWLIQLHAAISSITLVTIQSLLHCAFLFHCTYISNIVWNYNATHNKR